VYEGTVVEIVNVAIDVNVGVQMMYLRFEGASGGIWKLYVTESESSRGEGYDSWLPLRQYTGEKVRFVDPDPAVTICAPGSAEGVITAAAYNVANDTIYAYSSRGFNRQGIIKPDIAASGVAVIGAFAGSGSSSEDLLTTRSGSSVASAVLAGMAALVLEWGLVKGNAPYISTEEIKQLFIQGAARKDYLTYPDTSFGWGEVDILNSFNRLRL
jgi:subtilisin family serine protease